MEKTLTPEDDSGRTWDPAHQVSLTSDEHPQSRPLWRRWLAVCIISSACFCITCTSSIAGSIELPIGEEFGVSKEVAILGISLFVLGLGLGPLLTGPLSEMYGRYYVYAGSMALFFIFSFPVAFGNHIAVYCIFRFLTGFCGSPVFSVAGGSISDLFPNSQVAAPIALYTSSPFLGPVVGPIISGFVAQHTDWRWAYRTILIWSFVELLALVLFVPESYEPVLLKQKAAKLRKEGNKEAWAPLDKGTGRSLSSAIWFSCTTPFKLLYYEQMVLLLDTWTALLLGILYLSFQAFPIIFGDGHGFSVQFVGLSFLGLAVGVFAGLACQPIWEALNRRETAKHNGPPPPEVRLYPGMAGAILTPIGLYWLAFTTYPSVHWIVPIIGTIPFAMGFLLVFISVFTFLVSTYRPVAASAMASNSFLRSAFAAAFPLFTTYMYERLGTVGATAMLAGFTTIMAPLPFVFFKYGPRIRKSSRFAVDS